VREIRMVVMGILSGEEDSIIDEKVWTIADDAPDEEVIAAGEAAGAWLHQKADEFLAEVRSEGELARNVHCSNCGDTRGGPVGHEISECTWKPA
jgi:hypothetical protein